MYDINQADIDTKLEAFFTNAIAAEGSYQSAKAKIAKTKATLKKALKDLSA